MNTSKTSVVISAILGKLRSIIGYVLGAFSLLCIIVAISDINGEGMTAMIIFFTVIFVLCILLVISGAKSKQRIKRFKRYVSMISNENLTALENIASATSQSIDFVKKDLQKMIDKNFFANAFIDFKTAEIVIGNRIQSTMCENVKMQANASVEIENINCPGCGAVNAKLKGIPGNCDYCGTSLK